MAIREYGMHVQVGFVDVVAIDLWQNNLGTVQRVANACHFPHLGYLGLCYARRYAECCTQYEK